MSLPPDLQVLCRRLISTAPDELPALTPSLVNHVLRCEEVLSLPSDPKAKDGSPEVRLLVHKLKTQTTTLLNSRNPKGRFVGTILVKTILDVGGWECLKSSQPWVQGLLSILQKTDSAKEFSIITLTRIYTLLHEYQTLVREIATPTLPQFITACLQLVKPSASGKVHVVSPQLIQCVSDSLTLLIPLYPTTIRPFSAQIRTAFRPYLAPTGGDKVSSTRDLQRSARRVIIHLHYTAPKNGNAEEWAKVLLGLLKQSHATADQVFRAVEESWESTSGYTRQSVSFDGEPRGGSESLDELPAWKGLRDGSERLIGLFDFLTECISCPTKTPITLPLGSLLDFTSRITMALPPRRTSRNLEDGVHTNVAIGKEEKDELWSVLPDIHVAAMRFILILIQRLEQNIIPFAPDVLYQVVRVFDASQQLPSVREVGFTVIRKLLLIYGPNMDKTSVSSLSKIIQYCCQDLLSAAGHAQEHGRRENNPADASKTKATSSNADAFLGPQTGSGAATTRLTSSHVDIASALLMTLVSHVPQQYLKQNLRVLIDRTAVLCQDKGAMLSSVLNPYRSKNGKFLPAILPFLTRQFPNDTEVEVLRSNLRSTPQSYGEVSGTDDVFAQLQEAPEPAEMEEDVPQEGWSDNWRNDTKGDENGIDAQPGFALPPVQEEFAEEMPLITTVETRPTVQEAVLGDTSDVVISHTLKRKSEGEVVTAAAKRIDTGKPAELSSVGADIKLGEDIEDSDSDSGGSVHLDMTLDDVLGDEEDEEDDSD